MGNGMVANRVVQFGASVLAVGLATALGQFEVCRGLYFFLFLLGVVLTTWHAGTIPGLATAGLSCLTLAYFFLPPDHSFAVDSPEDRFQLGFFALGAIAVIASAATTRGWSGGGRVAMSSELSQSDSARAAGDLEGLLHCVEALQDGVEDRAVFTLDSQGCIASWNRETERLTGYGAGEVIGRHFRCFYPAEAMSEGQPDCYLDAAAGGSFCELRQTLLCRGTTPLHAQITVTGLRRRPIERSTRRTPVPGETSAVSTGFLIVLRDLGPRSRLPRTPENAGHS
jgi:PAS domain-containing protein